MCHNRTKSNMKMSSFNVMTKKKSSFEKLLEIDSSVSIHDKNLRTLAIEMYKIYHGISPTMIIEIFTLRHQTSIISEIGHISMFQKLKLLIIVLRVSDISILRFGILYQHI